MAPRTRSRLGRAVHATRRAAQLDQTELADAIGKAQPRISYLEGEPEQIETALDALAAIEEACGMPRGHILRAAGYVDDAPEADVSALISADESLGEGRDHLAALVTLMRNRGRMEQMADEGLAKVRAENAASKPPRRGRRPDNGHTW